MRPTLILISFFFSTLGICTPQVIIDMPNHSWLKLKRNGITVSSGIMAYSGGALDTQSRKFLVFGGGHSDYFDNDVWAFDLETLTWELRKTGSGYPNNIPADRFDPTNYPGAIFDTNARDINFYRPITRHTYSSAIFIPTTKEMFIMGSVAWYGSSGGSSGEIWASNGIGAHAFNYINNTWRYLGKEPYGDSSAATAFDPNTNSLWMAGDNRFYKYDIASGQWTLLLPYPQLSLNNHTSLTYDQSCGCLWMYGSNSPDKNEMWKYTIASNTWQKIPATGTLPNPNGGYGVIDYSINNELLLVKSGNLFSFNKTSYVWTLESPSNSPVGCGTTIGLAPYSRFEFDPVSGVAYMIAVCNSDDEVWAYKPRSSAPDTTPPTIASASAVSMTSVSVMFSEPVSQVQANMLTNYAINSVNIQSAAIQPDQKTVVLTVNNIAAGSYTLTVNNIADISGNVIVPNSQYNFSSDGCF